MVLYEKFEPFTHRSPFAFESQLDNFCLSSGDFLHWWEKNLFETSTFTFQFG